MIKIGIAVISRKVVAWEGGLKEPTEMLGKFDILIQMV